MRITINSLSFERAMKEAPDKIKGGFKIAATEVGELLDDYNKQNHSSWQNRTGEGQDDIGSKYDEAAMTLSHGLGFNPKVLVKVHDEYRPYTSLLHDGAKYLKGHQWIFKGAQAKKTEIKNIFSNIVKYSKL